MKNNYYVYIMTSNNNYALYTGVTNDLERRASEHKLGLEKGFTKKYHCTKLVYYEVFSDINEAIAREKQIKGGSRSKKIALVEKENKKWLDLSINFD